jgi:hypothetical protein
MRADRCLTAACEFTGLYYNGFRYYDPWVGRYTTPDPVNPTFYNAARRAIAGNPGTPLYLTDAQLQAARHYLGIPVRPISYDLVGGQFLWKVAAEDYLWILQRTLLENPNPYVYVGNNPVIWIDPWGLETVGIGTSVGSGVGVVGGFLMGPNGVHPYVGGGLMTPSLFFPNYAVSPSDPTPGWNFEWQATYGGGYSYGCGLDAHGLTPGTEYFEGTAAAPGASFVVYYVFSPIDGGTPLRGWGHHPAP